VCVEKEIEKKREKESQTAGCLLGKLTLYKS
jgi:hypothetical protein